MTENWSAERAIGPNESYVGNRLLFRSGNQVEANLIAPNLTLAGQLLRRAFMFGFLAFVLVGLLVGWRIHTSPLEALGGVLLLLAFAVAITG